MSNEDWELLDRQVVGYICTWLDDNVYHHVLDETFAYSLWKKLEDLYARKTAENKAFLMKNLMYLKYEERTPITDHMNEFQGIVKQLSSMKIVFDGEMQGLLLLGSLLDSWWY